MSISHGTPCELAPFVAIKANTKILCILKSKEKVVGLT